MPQPRRPRTREDPEARRDRILEEAIRVVGERGCYGFTVQDLAQRCGLSNAGLLYHFPSKDQLLVAMLDKVERREAAAMAPLAAMAQEVAGSGEASAAALLELFRTMVARASRQPEVGRLFMMLQAESLDASHPAHASIRARQDRVLEVFAKLVASYATEPVATARQLIALMEGLAHQWLREAEGFDISAEWDRALATVLPRLIEAVGRSTAAGR